MSRNSLLSVGRLWCIVGRHHRDPLGSRPSNGRYVSECADCGQPMVWSLSGWRIDRSVTADRHH